VAPYNAAQTAISVVLNVLIWRFLWLPRLREKGVGWRTWSVPALVAVAGVLLRTKSWWAGEAAVLVSVGMVLRILRDDDDDGPGPRRRESAAEDGPALHDPLASPA
jgi:hypothetical protein